MNITVCFYILPIVVLCLVECKRQKCVAQPNQFYIFLKDPPPKKKKIKKKVFVTCNMPEKKVEVGTHSTIFFQFFYSKLKTPSHEEYNDFLCEFYQHCHFLRFAIHFFKN